MSYILEALRKAERERNLGQVPTLEGLPDAPQPRRRRLWPWMLAAALAANVVIVVLVYTFPRQDRIATVERVPLAAKPAMAAPIEPQNPPTVEVVEPSVEEAPPVMAQKTLGAASGQQAVPADSYADDEVPAQKQSVQEPPAQEAAVPANADTAPAEPAVASAAESGRFSGEEETPPLLRDMPSEFKRSLPEMKIDAHFYSETPARRFVMINLHKYREGERLAEGPLLERIQADGLLLSYQGQRFRLPLPR